MKTKIKFYFSVIVLVFFIYFFNKGLSIGSLNLPRLGYFFSPFQGFWQNAESYRVEKFNLNLDRNKLQNQVKVCFDSRMVPHIFAKNDHDLYFTEGYIHAKFRLWQMDFISRAAGGRLSEILGAKTVPIDRMFRRIGLNYAAKNNLEYIEKNDTLSNELFEYYAAGINSYIDQLNPADYPLEFKLLNYQPEKWDKQKSLLIQMYMSFDLSGRSLFTELGLTNALEILGNDNYNLLYNANLPENYPIIPKGTPFAQPKFSLKIPPSSAAIKNNHTNLNSENISVLKKFLPNANNGSNNWVITKSKSKSGNPILCNDPHLGLNLPSIWFETQLSNNNTQNAYGVAIPGVPSIIIGFNDSIAWGLTNSGCDVIDTYEITFKDESSNEYLFNNKWFKTQFIEEIIHVKNKPDLIEKIPLTKVGLVSFNKDYSTEYSNGKNLAINWTNLIPNSLLKTFTGLNRANNVTDYFNALTGFDVPAQNFIFAGRSKKDIAIKQQGIFVARWPKQGDVTAEGKDSQYLWQNFVPQNEIPQVYNPPNDFLSSANQNLADKTYPFYRGNSSLFDYARAEVINKALAVNQNMNPIFMMQMQTNSYSPFYDKVRNFLQKNLDQNQLSKSQKIYVESLQNWDASFKINNITASFVYLFWNEITYEINNNIKAKSKKNIAIKNLSDYIILEQFENTPKNILDICTKQKSLPEFLTFCFNKLSPILDSLKSKQKLGWFQHNPLHLNHLLGEAIPAFNKTVYPLSGADKTINCIIDKHGPSWRMVVEMGDKIKAYGVYPGGQSGNPGSKFYDNFVTNWANGGYYVIIFGDQETVSVDKNIVLQFEY
ncbi:MAG: penicillin acylase family protein [Sediminibacterium sp.]|nr:penicillin acylase family protein [Sediminibacterium sp.]